MSALYNFWQIHQKRKILEHSYCQIFQHIYVCDSLGPNVTSMYVHENKHKKVMFQQPSKTRGTECILH